jgi:hypothetical protein
MLAGAPLTVSACSPFAGAICSVTWQGKEFIDATDHGRELQSASSFDGFGEGLNPTEGGSEADGAGHSSSSILLEWNKRGRTLEIRSRMAYWLKPGAPHAANQAVVSRDILTKKITLGVPGIENVLVFDIAFSVAEPHRTATFEVLTGYMPPEFSHFRTFNPDTGEIAELVEERQGEQPLPLIFSTADDRFAMGIYAPGLPQPSFPRAGYGRFRFPGVVNPGVVKWNCAFRYSGIAAKEYRFRCYVPIGSVEAVRAAMIRLRALPAPPVSAP